MARNADDPPGAESVCQGDASKKTKKIFNSRCLKCLYEKGCIQREKKDSDERSYSLSLTKQGEDALQNDFQIMLQTFYDLYREMGGGI